MTLFDRAYQKIKHNREQDFIGIPLNEKFPRLSNILPVIGKETFYAITAQEKVGKTKFTDDLFLYWPYEFTQENPHSGISIKIFYNSLEISKELKMINGISKKLFKDFGIIVPHKQIIHLKKSNFNDEVFNKIWKLREYFEKLEDVLVITDEQLSPKDINQKINKYAADNGKVEYKEVIHRDPKTGEEKTILEFDKYVPNNPDEYVIIITDHVSELDTSYNDGSIKSAIDEHYDNGRIWRNRYGYIPVNVHQQAAEGNSLQAHKLEKLEPSANMLGESRIAKRKVDVLLGLFAPSFHEIFKHRKYDISALAHNYRSLSVLLNRNGEAQAYLGMYFNGACDYFEELPKASDIESNPNLLEPYIRGQVGPLSPYKQKMLRL